MFGPISTDIYLSGLPQMVDDFATTEAILNSSLYLFMLVFAFSILISGPMGDKFGRRRMLLVSMVIYTVASLLCSLSTNIHLFIAMRVVQAVGAGGGLTSAFALIKDCFEGGEMAHILSIVAAIGTLGPILSPVLGAVMITLMDWRSTFWIPAVISFTCLMLAFGLPSELPKVRQSSVMRAIGSVFVIAKDGNFLMFTIMMTVFTASMLAYISVSSYVYQDMFGLDHNQFSAMLAIGCSIGLVISVIMRRYLTERPRRMLLLIMCMGILALVIMATLANNGWIFFLAGIIPVTAICTTTRSFGFGILMTNHDGDNGAVSSLLNFSTFILAFLGMMTASSFPSDRFVYGVATVLLASCTIFGMLLLVLRHRGYPLKGLS